MNDRYLCRGKRLDNGEWIEGNLIDFREDSRCAFIFVDPCAGRASTMPYSLIALNGMHMVDPATIEPVKAKTRRVSWSLGTWYGIKHYCPNCDTGLLRESNYCPDCGQALDWTHDAPVLIEGAE